MRCAGYRCVVTVFSFTLQGEFKGGCAQNVHLLEVSLVEIWHKTQQSSPALAARSAAEFLWTRQLAHQHPQAYLEGQRREEGSGGMKRGLLSSIFFPTIQDLEVYDSKNLF